MDTNELILSLHTLVLFLQNVIMSRHVNLQLVPVSVFYRISTYLNDNGEVWNSFDASDVDASLLCWLKICCTCSIIFLSITSPTDPESKHENHHDKLDSPCGFRIPKLCRNKRNKNEEGTSYVGKHVLINN